MSYISNSSLTLFKNLVDQIETEIKSNSTNPPQRYTTNEGNYVLEYSFRIPLTSHFSNAFDSGYKYRGLVYDTIALTMEYENKYNRCISKAIRTWKPDDSFEWFGYGEFENGEFEAICGFGQGIQLVQNFNKYIDIANHILDKLYIYYS